MDLNQSEATETNLFSRLMEVQIGQAEAVSEPEEPAEQAEQEGEAAEGEDAGEVREVDPEAAEETPDVDELADYKALANQQLQQAYQQQQELAEQLQQAQMQMYQMQQAFAMSNPTAGLTEEQLAQIAAEAEQLGFEPEAYNLLGHKIRALVQHQAQQIVEPLHQQIEQLKQAQEKAIVGSIRSAIESIPNFEQYRAKVTEAINSDPIWSGASQAINQLPNDQKPAKYKELVERIIGVQAKTKQARNDLKTKTVGDRPSGKPLVDNPDPEQAIRNAILGAQPKNVWRAK